MLPILPANIDRGIGFVQDSLITVVYKKYLELVLKLMRDCMKN